MRGASRIVAASMVAAAVIGQTVAAAGSSATEAAIAHLRSAVTPQRDGSHLPLLFSLRQLRDPSLRPLFLQLVQHPEWQIQVHAVLGLAELDPAERLDPWLMTQISPVAQEAVIASGLDMGMLGVDQIAEVLGLGELGAFVRVMLYAELVSLGRDIDKAELRRLSEDEDVRVAGLSSLLLAQLGDNAAFTSFQSRLQAMARAQQRSAEGWVLDAIRQYELSAANAWLRMLLAQPDRSNRSAEAIVLAAMQVSPEANVDLWRAHLGESPSYVQRVRCGLVLLASGERVPAAAYDDVVNGLDDPLLKAMADAGRALSTGETISQALINLVDIGHGRTTEWVMSVLETIDPAEAVPVYLHLIERAKAESADESLPVSVAVVATGKLFAIDPEAVLSKLGNSGRESPFDQLLLLGLFESSGHGAGEAASRVAQVGFGRSASLATLLMAKHAPSQSLDDQQLHRLGVLAGGGGRISDVLRAQAAWLYLKHTDALESALSRIVE